MRKGKGNEWTFLRQLAGNILPFIHWLPTFIGAWLLIALFQGSALVTTLVLIGVFASLTFGTWALFDRYGMFQNAAMRRALRPRLRTSLLDPPGTRSLFVGLATEGHFSLLDTDEDVGYLSLHPDRLAYVGDQISLVIHRKDILGVERRPIPGYSLLGYYWSVVRFEEPDSKETNSVRLLSREVDRLRDQPDANRKLWEELRKWYDETATAMVLPGGADAVEAARKEALRELDEWLDPAVVEPATSSRIREELSLLTTATGETFSPVAARADAAPALLGQQAREMIRDGADWSAIRPQLSALLRCMEGAEAFQGNYELLLGVYLALRARATELRLDLQPVPGDDALKGDPDLAARYETVFAEAAPEEGAEEAPWRALRRGRRLQAIFAHHALVHALEERGA